MCGSLRIGTASFFIPNICDFEALQKLSTVTYQVFLRNKDFASVPYETYSKSTPYEIQMYKFVSTINASYALF